MTLELKSAALKLTPREALRLRDAAGSTVCAVEGTVWITEEGQPRDIVLSPGACYRLRNAGLTLVNALGGGASVSLA